MDVVAAFDVIDQAKLYEIVLARIRPVSYKVVEYTLLPNNIYVPVKIKTITYPSVIELLQKAIFETSFSFNNQFYLLTKGTPQGSCLSSAFCYLYLDYLIKEVVWKSVISA